MPLRPLVLLAALSTVAVACGASSTQSGGDAGDAGRHEAGKADSGDSGSAGDSGDAGGAGEAGDAGDSGGKSDSGITAAKACTDVAAAECGRLETCAPALLKLRYGTVATCESHIQTQCSHSVAAPKTGNSAAHQEACSKAYPGWSCDDYLNNQNEPSDCAPEVGGVAKGSPCAFPGQCATRFCALAPNSACGTCQDQPKAGDSCAQLTTCGPGLACSQGSKTCVVNGLMGATCSATAPCGAHLSCVGADAMTGTTGTCTAAVSTVGGACDPTAKSGPACDFDAGLTCNTTTKKCATFTISSGGGPCGFVDGQFAACAAGGTCSATMSGAAGTCTAAAADGTACQTGSGGPGCINPVRCIAASMGSTSGTCQFDDGTLCK